MQFSLRTDSIVFYDGIGTDQDFGPFTPVNQCIVGTWYKSKSETVTFREDAGEWRKRLRDNEQEQRQQPFPARYGLALRHEP